MKEAKAFGEVVEVASSAEATYTYIPERLYSSLLMQIISTSLPITQSMEQNFMKTWILRFL